MVYNTNNNNNDINNNDDNYDENMRNSPILSCCAKLTQPSHLSPTHEWNDRRMAPGPKALFSVRICRRRLFLTCLTFLSVMERR